MNDARFQVLQTMGFELEPFGRHDVALVVAVAAAARLVPAAGRGV